MGNDVITKDISANQHFASTFAVQIFKFQRRSCKLSFLFPPRYQRARESLLVGYDTGGWKEKIRVLQTGVEPMTSCLLVQMLYHQATGDSVADPGEGPGGAGPPFIFGLNRNIFWWETASPPCVRVWITPHPHPHPPLSQGLDPALRLFGAEETRTRFM